MHHPAPAGIVNGARIARPRPARAHAHQILRAGGRIGRRRHPHCVGGRVRIARQLVGLIPAHMARPAPIIGRPHPWRPHMARRIGGLVAWRPGSGQLERCASGQRLRAGGCWPRPGAGRIRARRRAVSSSSQISAHRSSIQRLQPLALQPGHRAPADPFHHRHAYCVSHLAVSVRIRLAGSPAIWEPLQPLALRWRQAPHTGLQRQVICLIPSRPSSAIPGRPSTGAQRVRPVCTSGARVTGLRVQRLHHIRWRPALASA